MIIISLASQGILWWIDPDFEFSLFGNKKAEASNHLSYYQSWMSILIIFVFTMLTIRLLVQKTRRDAKVALETYYQDMSKYKD